MTDAYLSERDCYSRKIKSGDIMLFKLCRVAHVYITGCTLRIKLKFGATIHSNSIGYGYIADHWTHLPERAEMKSADIMMNEANGTNRQLCHVYVSDVLCIIIKTNCHIFWDRSQHYCSCCGWKLLGTS